MTLIRRLNFGKYTQTAAELAADLLCKGSAAYTNL